MSVDKSSFRMDTRINGRDIEDVVLNLSYKLGNPNKINFAVTINDEKKFEILAIVFTPEIAYSIIIKTPFKDFEELTISGQFGSTALKSMYSFKNYRIQRSLSFEYNEDLRTFVVLADLPYTRFKRFALRNDITEGVAVFNFELEHENEFAVGIQYDLDNIRSSGSLYFKIDYYNFDADYSVNLSYDIPDETLKNGINAKVAIKKDGSDWYTGKLSRTIGRTYIEVTTPIVGWNHIKIEMFSDWMTTALINFQRDSRFTHIYLEQHGTYDYNITFITPFDGYKHIEITSKKDKEKIALTVKNENQIVSEISLLVEMIDISRGTGNIQVKWDASNNIFVHIKAGFDGVKAKIQIETSFEQVELVLCEIAIQKSGTDRKTKAVLKINEEFISYESLITWTDLEFKSKSKVQTNSHLLAFNKSETELKLEYSKDLKSFYKLTIETITDDIITFNTFSTLKLNMQDAQIKLVYKGEFPVMHGKIDAVLQIDSNLETKFELKGNWSSSLFHAKLKLTGKNAEAKFESTFLNFEKLKGRALWTIAQGENSQYGLNLQLENCNTLPCTSSLKFAVMMDTLPFSNLKVQLLIPGYLNESLSIKYTQKEMVHSIVADFDGIKVYHINATINISKRSVNILIKNKTDKRTWRLKTNAEFELLENESVIINVQLLVYTPFTKDFKAIVILDMESQTKQFELTFKYGIIDASIQTKFLWSFSKSDILFKILCPSIGVQTISFEAIRNGLENFKYKIWHNKNIWEIESKNVIEESTFIISIHLLTPWKKFEQNSVKIIGNRTDEDLASIDLNIGGTPFHGSFKRNSFNVEIIMTSEMSYAKKVRFETNIDNCKQYNFKFEFNEKSINIESSISCQSYEANIKIETDFTLCKKLSVEFTPIGDANFDISLNYIGMNMTLKIIGNIRSMEQEKYFIWNIDFNDQPFKANMSYSIQKNIKRIEMFYIWSGSKIEIISSLDTSVMRNPYFQLQFKSPFKNIEQVNFEASLGDQNSKLEGKLFVLFNNKTIFVQLGSFGNHLYLEAKTPITGFQIIKFDINHLKNSVKTKTLLGNYKLDANFNKKNTIYNFDISSNLFNKIIKFNGKIDISSKALQTLVMFDEFKLRMKANTNGQSMSASLTSDINNIRNVKVKGNWKWIEEGFSVEALANFLDSSKPALNEFHAQFHSNADKTSGFWKVKSSQEEIIFTMKIDKSNPNGMSIYLSINLPNLKPIFCHIKYSDEERFVSGSLEFTNPWKYVNISFSGGFKTDEEFEFRSTLSCPEEIFNLEVIVKVINIDDIEFKIRCIIPHFKKDFGTIFQFKPHSLYNFKFFTILTINEQQFGGGASLVWNTYSVDVIFSIHSPIVSGEYKIGGKYSISYSKVITLLYFNSANLEIQYDIVTGDIHAESNFNIQEIITRIFGNDLNVTLTDIKIKIDYIKSTKGEIFIHVGNLGKLESGFKLVNSKLTFNFDILVMAKSISKSVFLTVDFKKTGTFEFFIKDKMDWYGFEMKSANVGLMKIRKIRAAIPSEEGIQEFNFIQKLNQGIIMFSTNSGIHKMTYELKSEENTNLLINIESPYLNNGFASASFSINNKKRIYESRFSVNNDHFLYAFVKAKVDQVEAGFSLETKYLTEKLSGTFQYYYFENLFFTNIEVSYYSSHKVDIEINFTHFSAKGKIESPLLYCQQISMEIELVKEDQNNNFYLTLYYGENNFEIELKFYETTGKKGMLSCRSSQFSIIKFTLKWELEISTDIQLKLDLETANPQYSKFIFIVKLLSPNEREPFLKIILKLPHTNYEIMDLELQFIPEGDCFKVTGNLVTPHGIYVGDLGIYIEQDSFLLKLKINRPFDSYYYALVNVDWKDEIHGTIDALLPFIGRLEVSAYVASASFELKNNAKFKLYSQAHYLTATVDYDFINSLELSIALKSSIEILNDHGVNIGFCNSERKMLKAHVNIFGKHIGIQFDYSYSNILDMNVLIDIDNPFENWSDINGHVLSDISDEGINVLLNLEYNDHQLQSLFNNKRGRKMAHIKLNENEAKVNLENGKNGEITVILPNLNCEVNMKNIQFRNEYLFTDINIRYNEKGIIRVTQNKMYGEFNILIKNILMPHHLNIIFHHISFHNIEKMVQSLKINLEYSWNIQNTHRSKVSCKFSLRSYGDGMLEMKLPNTDIVQMKIVANNAQKEKSTSMSHLQIMTKNIIKISNIYEQKILKHTIDDFNGHTILLKTESMCLRYETFLSSSDMSQSKYSNLNWGIQDCTMNLGFLERTKPWRNYKETENIIFFTENGNPNILAINTKSESEKNVIDITFDHYDNSRDFSIKIVPKYSETTQSLTSGILIGYFISGKKFRYLEVEGVLSKNTESLNVYVGYAGNNYEIQVQ